MVNVQIMTLPLILGEKGFSGIIVKTGIGPKNAIPLFFKNFPRRPLTKSQNLLYFPSMIEKSILGR